MTRFALKRAISRCTCPSAATQCQRRSQSAEHRKSAASTISQSEPAKAPAKTAAPVASAAAAVRSEDEIPEGLIALRAPMLGTFYRAPSPGAKPFVEVGDKVSPDDTVCLVEVMKLFNSIKAGVAGTVVKLLVENGAMVEHGQPLILIEHELINAPGTTEERWRVAIKRLFIANRGEIAVRIINACQKLGVETVLGVSEADRETLGARLADRAVCIGPAPALQSYLNMDAIVTAAKGTGCDAATSWLWISG